MLIFPRVSVSCEQLHLKSKEAPAHHSQTPQHLAALISVYLHTLEVTRLFFSTVAPQRLKNALSDLIKLYASSPGAHLLLCLLVIKRYR